MKKICLVLIFSILLFSLTSCISITIENGGSGSEEQSENTPATSDNGETKGTEPAETEAPTSNTSSDGKLKVGDKLKADGFEITYLSSGVYESDNIFYEPDEGNVYIYLELFCENISSDSYSVSSILFDCYADGYKCDSSYANDDGLSATLSKGKGVVGSVCFEIPEDAEEVEIEYEYDFWNEKKAIFVYEGEKDSGIEPKIESKKASGALSEGDTVEADGLKITYIECGEYDASDSYYEPADGNVFIYATFEIENVSGSDQYVSSFYCYADGWYCPAKYLDGDSLDYDLSAGRKTKGNLYFEVPEDADTVEIEYRPSLLSDGVLVFTYEG